MAERPKPIIRALRRRAALAAALLGALLHAAVAGAAPAVGEAAPPFALAGTDGRTYTLEGLLAEHGGVVLAWFPRAFTPG